MDKRKLDYIDIRGMRDIWQCTSCQHITRTALSDLPIGCTASRYCNNCPKLNTDATKIGIEVAYESTPHWEIDYDEEVKQ